MADRSRNESIFAEWEAEEERRAEGRRRDPEGAARMDALVARLGVEESSEEERQARSLARHATDSSLWCSRCRTEFAEGDVVYRVREPVPGQGLFGAGWKLAAICDDCVRKYRHPSWRENRNEPIPCAGGCGVLVSHWYFPVTAIATCSKRCSRRVEVERRRVKHETRRCEVCGEEFTPKRSDSRYCRNACRQRAYRERRSELDA